MTQQIGGFRGVNQSDDECGLSLHRAQTRQS
jgi:hypothetical protein